jgi:hypothetical protein
MESVPATWTGMPFLCDRNCPSSRIRSAKRDRVELRTVLRHQPQLQMPVSDDRRRGNAVIRQNKDRLRISRTVRTGLLDLADHDWPMPRAP